MLKRSLRFGLLVALGFALFGQTKPKDVDGWDKIKWGMTMADVRAAYGIDTEPETKDGWTLLQLKPVKLGRVEMGVQVGARQDAGKVTSVKLWSYFGLSTSAPGASGQDFDALKMILIQEYGQPASEETKHGENFRLLKTVLWKFPSTSILMTLEQSSSLPNLGNISLDYTAANQ
jgi:hypothetical protein